MKTKRKEWIILGSLIGALTCLLALNYIIFYWPISGYVLATIGGYLILFGIIIAQQIKNAILKDNLDRQDQSNGNS